LYLLHGRYETAGIREEVAASGKEFSALRKILPAGGKFSAVKAKNFNHKL
jgi:hypothetical protein